MKHLQTHLRLNLVIISSLLLCLSTSQRISQRISRRIRSTASPDSDPSAGAENEYAARAVIGRINSSGHAFINTRARDIINNQNARKVKESHSYVGPNVFTGNGPTLTVNCSTSCTPREVLKQVRVEAIKLDILRKLRISTLPNMTNHRIPDIPFVRNLLERNLLQSDQPYVEGDGIQDSYEPDPDRFTTLRSIIFPKINSSTSNPDSCFFTFKSRAFNSEIINATFGVYVKRTGSDPLVHPVQPAFVFLHKVNAQGRTEVYMKRKIPTWLTEAGHWIQFDLKFLVREWSSRPETNRGLKIVIEDNSRRFEAICNPQNPEDESHISFLDVSVREKDHSVSRRSMAATCDERSNERKCCRYPLIIDFEVFRWDWVIAPRMYHAFYCSGECPFTYVQTHPHTHVVHQHRADGKSGGPCCSPRQLSPISLLYFDTHMNIISGVLPGMVVDRCSCS